MEEEDTVHRCTERWMTIRETIMEKDDTIKAQKETIGILEREIQCLKDEMYMNSELLNQALAELKEKDDQIRRSHQRKKQKPS